MPLPTLGSDDAILSLGLLFKANGVVMRATHPLLLRVGSTGLLFLSGLAALGCTSVRGLDALPITFSYEGQAAPPLQSTVQAEKRTGRTVYRLLDHVIAYRDDHKAVIEFDLAPSTPFEAALIHVEAYNDDALFPRAVRFELDGQGGYLGTVGILESGQVRGAGVLAPKEKAEWHYDLLALGVGHTVGEGVELRNNLSLLDRLRSPGHHKIVAWVSTYAQYGPASWLTLDLVLGSSERAGRSD